MRSGGVGLRYLLVGNAPNSGEAVARAALDADVIVQHNTCEYAALLPEVRANYVFITNSGFHALKIIERLLAVREAPVFGCTRLILARNPAFYTFKKYLLRAGKHVAWRHYGIHRQWTALSRVWPIQTMSFLSSARLERGLRNLGMESWRMPSTGMISYDWLCRRLEPRDSLVIEGYKFDNWYGHPRHIEKELIRPISPEEGRARRAILEPAGRRS